MAPREAVAQSLKELDGAFALVMLFAGEPDLLICARRGSPLAVGFGEGEMFVGSDALALAPLTRRIVYLEEGDWAEVTGKRATIRNADDQVVERPIRETALSGALIGKGNHRHYMKKEIFEQPTVIGDTLLSHFNPATRGVHLPHLPFDLAKVNRVTLIACGTSFHAALVAKYWLEKIARVSCEVDIASEFRYRAADMPAGELAVFISQSGETADTLAALALCQGARLAHPRRRQPAGKLDRARGRTPCSRPTPGPRSASPRPRRSRRSSSCSPVSRSRWRAPRAASMPPAKRHLSLALTEVPARASEVLNHDERILAIAQDLAETRDVLYLGRGTSYPLALEGALKLKEISYIHAEGYAAGEMKHGPIALINDGTPIVVLAPSDELFEKTLSNMQEVLARGGRVVMISDREGLARLEGQVTWSIEVPRCESFVAPLLYAIPVQLLAYHIAVIKGTDVDQPRNLAKSVTVE